MNTIKTVFKRAKSFATSHKIWSGVIIIIVLFIGYKVFGGTSMTVTRYVTTTVQKETIISSVSATGQVEASSSIDLKAKVSGTVTSVNVKSGQTVYKGQTLFSIDAQDALKGVRDAELNLEIAQNDLENAKKDFASTQVTQDTALKNLLLDLNSSVAAIPDSNNTNTNIVSLSGSYTNTEQGRYTLEVYGCENNGECIKYSGLEQGSFRISTNVLQPLGVRGIYVSFSAYPKTGEKWYIDLPSHAASSYAANLRAYEEGKLSIPKNIDTSNQNVVSKELSLKQKQNALIDAKQTLSNYYVAAPFSGKIASVVAHVGDTASDTLGTIITDSKIATITLNEVDVSKISLGQKATLTFDAVNDLTITGEVVEIDGVGTVTQGVVSYTVKISFDTDDIRIKPGMSVSAAIITNTKQDVLVVPSQAVKNNTNGSYVEVFSEALPVQTTASVQGSASTILPKQTPVEVGISNDTSTEIISGLKEGDIVVTKTIASSATTKVTTNTAPSLLGSGRTSVGGGALRGATGR